jgi:hypothetical protein
MADPNLKLLQQAVADLGDLADELVFVGGCTTGLFITDEASAEIRPTKDVDAIVRSATYSQYIKFGERLEKAGFRRDVSQDAPICRWVKNGTVLDVLPVSGGILGFRNSWYEAAVANAESREISAATTIKVVSPSYFLATKLEAFDDRGKNDFLGSRDIEDVVTVINGRAEIVDEINASEIELKNYVRKYIARLLKNRDFVDSLPGHLMPDTGRVEILVDRLRKISRS